MAYNLLGYLADVQDPAVEPSYSTIWTDTTHVFGRRRLGWSKTSTADGGMNNNGFDPVSSGDTSLIGQFVSTAPGAHEWTTSDTFDFAIRCIEDNAANNDYLYLVIRVVNSSGVQVGVLYSGQVNATEISSSDYICRHADSVAIQNSVSMSASDLIVVEVGIQALSTSAGYAVIRICDAHASDLPLNDTENGALNSWIGFTYGGAVAPTVTTTAPSALQSAAGDTATGGGNVTSDGGATVTDRGVCWSTSSNPTTADSHTHDSSGTGSFVSSLTGLTPHQQYHVRAWATNSVGTSYGSDETFTPGYATAKVISE